VTTEANWKIPGSESITLTQTKGTYNWKGVTGKTGTSTGYGYYDVKVTAISGSGKSFSTTFSGGSKKIDLAADTSYKITVSYNSVWTALTNNSLFGNSFVSWKTNPSWKVSSTWKVSSCS